MNCELEKDELTGKFICKICGVKLPVNAQINCRMKRKQAENKPPPLVQRVANFASAATAHAAAGNPKVTKEVMQERLAICRSCPLFKPNKNEVGGVCTHETCGCNIQDNLNYLNKIAWADQECPIKRWGKGV